MDDRQRLQVRADPDLEDEDLGDIVDDILTGQ
jgi:hypothetical protein